MSRKFLSIIILTSMILHCSSRLGLLSYLYDQRHALAVSVGLISEVPIAICSSDYNLENNLRIVLPDAGSSGPVIAQAHEINLFFVSPIFVSRLSVILDKDDDGLISCPNNYSLTPIRSIFHPPAV